MPVQLDFESLKVIVSGKTEAGREFQFLEVMGGNELANVLVRYFCNLTAEFNFLIAFLLLQINMAMKLP